MADPPVLNAYVCPNGHRIVTIARVEGTTPLTMLCRRCPERATSTMGRVPADVLPTHEWYRPSLRAAARMGRGTRQHVAAGGLLLRPIPHLALTKGARRAP